MVLHVIKFEVTDLLESGARVFSANQNVGKSKPKTIPQLLLLLTNASFFFRQYHCWNCGEVFCKRCIDKQCTLPGHYSDNRVPVCKQCYKVLKKFKWDAALLVSHKDKEAQVILITLRGWREIFFTSMNGNEWYNCTLEFYKWLKTLENCSYGSTNGYEETIIRRIWHRSSMAFLPRINKHIEDK